MKTFNYQYYIRILETIHHHHLVVPSARISLTLSRHLTLSFIASDKSSGLHPVTSQSCCIQVPAGHPAFTRPCEGVHSSASLMSSFLLLQQCPACLVRANYLNYIEYFLSYNCVYFFCIKLSIWYHITVCKPLLNLPEIISRKSFISISKIFRCMPSYKLKS